MRIVIVASLRLEEEEEKAAINDSQLGFFVVLPKTFLFLAEEEEEEEEASRVKTLVDDIAFTKPIFLFVCVRARVCVSKNSERDAFIPFAKSQKTNLRKIAIAAFEL